MPRELAKYERNESNKETDRKISERCEDSSQECDEVNDVSTRLVIKLCLEPVIARCQPCTTQQEIIYIYTADYLIQ